MATVAEALLMAKRYLQGGDLHQAEILYRQVLQAEPLQAEALHFLGILALQVGKNEVGVALLEQSIAIAPGNAGFHYNLGKAYQAQGQLDQAMANYRETVRLQPDFADAHNNLGNALADLGRLDMAVACYQRAVALHPSFAEVHYNLANTLKKLGKLVAATASYRQALLLNPDYAEAHGNLATLFLEQNKLEEAVTHYQIAVRLNPRDAQAHNNLGNALRMEARLEDAKASYRLALYLQPDYAEAHYNLGQLLVDQMKPHEAIASYEQAIRLNPDLADAHAGLGIVLGEQGKAEEAVTALQKALELRPSEWLRIAVATHLPVIYQSMADLESWRSRLLREVGLLREQQVVHDATEKPALTLFYLAYQGCNDRDIQRDVARLYNAERSTFDVRCSELKRRTSNIEHRRIRVGFLSSFFWRHTIGHLTGGLVAKLSRKDFEVIVLSVGRHEDKVAAFFKQHADRFVEIPRHLPTARRLIGEQELDVLFYTDIGMDQIPLTLAHSRLAPVQCTTWGHPVTTGIDTMDYFISSKDLETEEADQHYTETLVQLENLPIFYYRPELPRPPLKREDFGLTSESHIYGCPQSLFKLHPEFDAVLGGILRGDPRGVLLLNGGLAPRWEQLLRQRFAATLPDVVNRVHFLPRLKRPEFLNMMTVCDVLLDPLHFGGGNTSYEGLAMGVPIVTLPSQFLRGRITFALYKQMGMLDCVVHGPREYIDLALRLGTDRSYRDKMRAMILDANSVLYENSTGVKELEEFLKWPRSWKP
jgi:protein O-GlcNAc transferase